MITNTPTKGTNFFVSEIKDIVSKHGGRIYEIVFIDVLTKTEWLTYVDKNNWNYKKWQPLIELPSNDGVILKNLKVKDNGKRLLSADSKPVVEIHIENGKRQMEMSITQTTPRASYTNTSNHNFNDLFVIDTTED